LFSSSLAVRFEISKYYLHESHSFRTKHHNLRPRHKYIQYGVERLVSVPGKCVFLAIKKLTKTHTHTAQCTDLRKLQDKYWSNINLADRGYRINGRGHRSTITTTTTTTIINNDNYYEMVETCNNIIHILYRLRRRTPLRSTAEAL